MPAKKRRGLHHSQGLSPIKPVCKPDQGETRGIRCTFWFDMSFLVESQLFAQKENLCCKQRVGAQTQSEEAYAIDQKRQQRAKELPEMAEQVWR